MMKKQILLSVALLFFIQMSNAQWTIIGTGSSANYESIYFFDSNNGIASSTGNVIKTTNGGDSWAIKSVSGLRDIDFVNSSIGYGAGVVGRSLNKTIDGGNTWTSLSPITSNSLWGVSAVDENTVYVCGTGGVVWKSTNGGVSFTAKNITAAALIVDIDFTSTTEGCALAQTAVWKTINGGNTWTETYTSGSKLFTSIYLVDAQNGYAVGSNGMCIKTTDGCNSWTELNTGTNSYLQYVYFLDVNHGIACGMGGVVITTIDGGITWENEITGTTENLNSCILLSTSIAIAAGENGIMIKDLNINSVDEIYMNKVNIYPNPSKDKITIEIQQQSIHNNYISIYNTQGKLLIEQPLQQKKTNVNIGELSKGTYFLKLKSDYNIEVTKFIKE